MSGIGQPTGGTISDQMLSDASFGDVMQGGTGDFGTGAGANAFSSPDFGSGFSGFNSFINALSGGGGGAAPIANAQAPVAPGNDPTAAAGGTQSNTAPGQSPQQPQPGQGGPGQPQQNQQQQQGGDVVAQLRELLKRLEGKPTGPTGQVPQPPRTPTVPGALNALFGGPPAEARLPPDQQGRQLTIQPRARPVPPDPTIVAGGPGAGAGVAAPVAPYRPEDDPRAAPPAATPPAAPASTPTPTPVTPPYAQQAQPQQMSRLMRDIAGISQGNPASLLDLVSALYPIIGGLRIAASGGRPIGHDVNFAGPGELQDLKDDRDRERGVQYGTAYDKNGNPSPHGAFDRNGMYVASPDKMPTSNQIPGVTPQIADNYWRQGAKQRGIDPDTASKVLGAESGYGQNNINQRDVNGYPDYGPAQLNMAPGALGAQFQAAGLGNPADFAHNWQKQMDFALDHIAKEGWTDLYPGTSKKLGLSRWSGINRPPPAVSLRTEGTNPGASFLATS